MGKKILMLSIGTLLFNIICPNGDFNCKQYIMRENYLWLLCLISTGMDHEMLQPCFEIRSQTTNK